MQVWTHGHPYITNSEQLIEQSARIREIDVREAVALDAPMYHTEAEAVAGAMEYVARHRERARRLYEHELNALAAFEVAVLNYKSGTNT